MGLKEIQNIFFVALQWKKNPLQEASRVTKCRLLLIQDILETLSITASPLLVLQAAPSQFGQHESYHCHAGIFSLSLGEKIY